MSRQFIQSLKGLQDGIKIDLTEQRKHIVEEGYSAMKSSISDIEVPTSQKVIHEKVTTPVRSKKSVADQALQMYGKITTSNGGDDGQPTETGANGGDLGEMSLSGEHGGSIGVQRDNYAALTTSMTLEEYEEYIENKFNTILEDDLYTEEDGEDQEFLAENPIVTELEKRLLKLEDHSWIAIDKVMRQLAKEEEITPKELNRMFREEHDGQIPDDWVKENQIVEQCGWIPLDEAVRVSTNGQVFEVTFMHRCQYRRWRFFWPEVHYPTPCEIQRCVEMIYPNGKMISYYPVKCPDNFMVFVPPMTNNYVVLAKEDWLQMSDEDQETMELITEEYGQATSVPCLMEDGAYQMMIADKSGEQLAVRFGGILEYRQFEFVGTEPVRINDQDYTCGEPVGVEVKEPAKKKKDVRIVLTHPVHPPKHEPEDTPKQYQSEGAAWTKKSGKNEAGGLNEKGRKSYEKENPGSDLKAPSKKVGNPRRASFCARMSGMKKKLTSKKTASDPDSRINKSLRKWNC